jgi:hypothetical protein
MRRTAVAAAICLAVACGTEPDAPPADFPGGTTSAPGGLASALGTCVNTIPGDATFRKVDSWKCGTEILVKGQDATLGTAITTAIGTWNGVYGHNGLPKFVTSATQTQTPVFTVNVTWGATSGAYYCGDTDPGTRQITINRSSTAASCGGETSTNPIQVASLPKLIAHELSHSIGFKHLSQLGSVPASDNCVASLPQAGGLNGGLCQHEILNVQYYYGVYPSYVLPGTYIATSVEVSGVPTASPGESKPLTAFPSWDVAPTTTVKYAWSSTNTAIATVGSSITASNTVQAVSPGTTTLRARITTSGVLVVDPQAGDLAFTVNPPPPPPPTGLNATSITANAATIRWTNGAADATTNLYYRKTGVATWTDSVTGIAAGTTSRQLTNLAGATSYDVRAKHVRGGQSSSFTSTIQFTTLAASAPTITNFVAVVCNQQVAGAKTYNYFTMTWNATPDQTTGSYQIGVYTSNSPASAAIATTVPATSETGVAGGYLNGPVLVNRWFWVRYTGASGTTPWVPLTPNPLATNVCLR